MGPNGSGKTTTLRILATILKPSYGDVRVFGLNVVKEASKVRELISYLPEEADLYRRLTGYENLMFFARMYSSVKKEVEEMVEFGIKLSELGNRIHDRAETYSKGMRRRLALARTLMVKPRLAILDEPTAGLDVYASVKVRNAIKMFVKETGSTVLLSSHNMLEVEYLCDRVAFICKGRILDEGNPNALKKKYNAKNLEEAFIRVVQHEL
ncbi:MAG: multidrug ABC transporter ATP-binding protein [Desulfurococcales archaeon ex4484_217_2]|nr:MAG: multidrug ABC transporter ATP-binding protein [Desulfurococcales archaeon ex4484_217_2]